MITNSQSNLLYYCLYWIYLPLSIYYSSFLVDDLPSNILFFLSLALFTSIVHSNHHKKLLITIFLLLILDFILKISIIMEYIRPLYKIQTSFLFNFSLNQNTIIYIILILVSFCLPLTYHTKQRIKNQLLDQLNFLQFLSNIVEFTAPLILYLLCYTKVTNNSFRNWLQHLNMDFNGIELGNAPLFVQVGWSLAASLFLMGNKINKKLICFLVLCIIIRDHYVYVSEKRYTLYLIDWKIILTLKCLLLFSFRLVNIYRQTKQFTQNLEQEWSRSNSRMSTLQKFVIKKKIKQNSTFNQVVVFLVIALTMIVISITNGLGNTVLIIAIGLNFPNFNDHLFRTLVGIGILISLLLQPWQFVYFILAYIIKGLNTNDQQFKPYNLWILQQLGRICIMLSKISLLNFLIGLFQNQWLVLITLGFRNIFSYFQLILVFMGTQDNYPPLYFGIFPHSIFVDSVLWGYFLLLRFSSSAITSKFSSTDITDIFKEYPLFVYFQKALKLLKIFHWIAYVSISMTVLNSPPSLFTIMRIAPLLIVFTAGFLESHKSQCSLRLWVWNLYTALTIAFVKYFYMLRKYQNLSQWLVRLLQPLQRYQNFIGFTTSGQLSLLHQFGPDFVLILVNSVVIYTIKVQLSELNYEQIKARIKEQQHLSVGLLQEQKQKQTQKNIHYLYHNYIKPIQLQFHQNSNIRKLFTDFIIDICFFCFLVIYYLFCKSSTYIYLCHFILFYLSFQSQKGKHYYLHIFQILIALCSIDLLIVYIIYFWSLVDKTNSQYNFITIISKYCMIIIAVIFSQINSALQKYHHLHVQVKKQNHQFFLIKSICPDTTTEIFKKQIIILYFHAFKSISWAFYIGTLILLQNNYTQLAYILGLCIFVILYFIDKKRQLLKRNWIYIHLLVFLLCIWNGHILSYLGVVCNRLFYMVLQQFQHMIYVEKYGLTNKTSNQQNKKKVQSAQKKLLALSHLQHENMLDVISEVQSIRQKSQFQDQKQSFSQDQSKQKYYNTYITIVWLLPIVIILIQIFGQIMFFQNIISLVLVSINFCLLMYILKYLFSFTITNKIVTNIFIFKFILSIFGIIKGKLYPQQQNSYIGIWAILASTLYFYQLRINCHNTNINSNLKHSYHINFSLRCCQQAIQYWIKKCELVSQLGSQIHNQKKIVSLKKFFINRENLSIKVKQLSQELKSKSSHRKSRFESLQKLQNEQQIQVFRKQQFQVFSNMLTFMSQDDLEFCYSVLNKYYKKNSYEQDVSLKCREIRKWVIENYQRSLNYTLSKYYDSHERKRISYSPHPDLPLQQIQQQRQISSHYIIQPSIQNMLSKKVSFNIIEQKNQFNQQQPVSLLILPEIDQGISSKSLGRQQYGQRIDIRLNQLSWIFRKIIQNIQIIGLIITAGWNFFGGIYTIPVNIAIFSWAIVLQTKTTVVFWSFLMIYSFLILSIKMILPYFPNKDILNLIFFYHSTDYIYEYLIIFVSSIQIIFLKMGGTAEIAYSQRQNIYQAFFRNLLNQSAQGKIKQKQKQFLSICKSLQETKHSFFYRVFSKGRLKPGKDLYPLLAIVQVIILLYIFFFYDMMEFESKNNRKSLGQILTVTQFSRNMIIALFFQVLIMVLDRVIVSLNLIDKLNQKLQNFIFNIVFKSNLSYEPLSQQQISKLTRFDYLLILKYLFHVILLVTINFLVYLYIPSGGFSKSLIPQCNKTQCQKSYNYLSIFLLFYLIYFVISGLQIKHGFNRNKCRNTLMERHNWVDYYIYMFFTGVPFLWQFKKISDWTITSTALPLFHWMKFEDINARMYQSKCQSQILKQKQLGKAPWYRLFIGPPGFILILCVVFSPILMYSSLNPFAVQDSILSASTKLQLSVNNNNYIFFQASHTTILNQHQFTTQTHVSLLGFFDRANIFKLQTSSFPDSDFLLSQPTINRLSQQILQGSKQINNKQFVFRLFIKVSQKQGGDSSIQWGSKLLKKQQLSNLYQILINKKNVLQIKDFYSPFPGQINNKTIFLINHNNGQYFQLSSQSQQTSNKGTFFYYKSSVKYKLAFGLLTFYLTYVVLINSLLRVYLTGGLQNILFQGCQMQKILFLCQAVRSARILQNFIQQQYLYFSLVDLMRYPKMIKDVAQDFTNLRPKKKIQ